MDVERLLANAKNDTGHAVVIHLRLSRSGFGSFGDRWAVYGLERRLAKAIASANVGGFDGHDFGEGQAILYAYGPDADTLFAAISLILKKSRLATGGYAIKRYGGALNLDTREERVSL